MGNVSENTSEPTAEPKKRRCDRSANSTCSSDSSDDDEPPCKSKRTSHVSMGDPAAGAEGPWVVGGVSLEAVEAPEDGGWDAAVAVLAPGLPLPDGLEEVIAEARARDASLDKVQQCIVLTHPRGGGGRLILASTGPLTPYDDVRSLGEAMTAGVRRALAAGARRPLLLLHAHALWPRAPIVQLLGALEALYAPLQVRESFPSLALQPPVTALGVCGRGLPEGANLTHILQDAVALEQGRIVARDVGGADPERMTPSAAALYLQHAFEGSCVTVRVLDDAAEIKRRYPLLAAVTRAADTVPRHRACVVYLEYVPETYEKTLMFVGKGVTYDTGGCDIKVGGAMAGMSRDKCGAASVAGFLKTCSLLRPPLKVVASLGFVRNSVGADAYVADELLTARSGRVVRVGNTDAEGRMVMADLLDEMRERAASFPLPHLYTVATLTGHAARAYGPYTAAMDSHAARVAHHARRLSEAGERIGVGIEVSRIRREDLAAHTASGDAHLLQAESRPSTMTPRGHQAPAAFLLMCARLEGSGGGSGGGDGGSGGGGSVPYTHLDIAASAGDYPRAPTAAPLLALAEHYGLLHAC